MSIGLKANSDGSGAIQIGGSDAITISTGLNTTFAGTAAVPTGTLYPIVSGTSVSASGTAVDFTSIPSWVKRITVMFQGVSTNGTSLLLLQLGAGSIETTGYTGAVAQMQNAVTSSVAAFSSGFITDNSANAAAVRYGSIVLTQLNASSNLWSVMGIISRTDTATTSCFSGTKTLSGTLDRVRVTATNGTDTFDAGSINILYE